MTPEDYAKSIEGKRGNCWTIARGWLEAKGRTDILHEVADMAGRKGRPKTKELCINPTWLATRAKSVSTNPTQGSLALMPSLRGWGLGVALSPDWMLHMDTRGRVAVSKIQSPSNLYFEV